MTTAGTSLGVVLGSASRRAGGLFSAVPRLTQSVAGHGASARIHALRDADSAEDAVAWGRLPLDLFSVAGPAQLGYSPGLARSLAASGHDILHQHGIWQGFSASVRGWGRRTGRPVVISPHGMLDPWALANSAWKKRIAGFLYENGNLHHAACLHALNESERLSIRHHGLRNPIMVLPNGIDPPPAGTDAPAPWSDMLPQCARTLLFVGRIHPKKGIDLLLQAMAAGVPDGEDWHLVTVGWDQGGHAAELKALAQTLPVASRVHFLGPLYGDAKWSALRHADAFVLPSHSEGLPMSVLEAWSAGLPVLMTRACNLPEGPAAGAAIEVETGVGALREGLARLIALSDGERHAMGEAGRQLVASRFTWDGIGAQMCDTYRWLLSGGAAPSWVDVNG